MSPARARTRTARSGVERTNHEATAPPQMMGNLKSGNRNPESETGIRNRNRKPETGIRNPQGKENKFFKFAKII